MAQDAPSAAEVAATMRSRRFIALLALSALVGVAISAFAWGFLQLLFHMQDWAFTDLPEGLGFDDAPVWWPLPVLGVAGLLTAFAIARLPGEGGHVPAEGLSPAPTRPAGVPGVLLAGLASIGLGAVVGPEAPLIAVGGAFGLFALSRLKPDAPPEVAQLVAASGAFAALAFLFGSPIVAAVFLIEALAIGGARLPLVLVPGLLASGIGSLVWIGMGSWTGLSTSDISINPLHLASYAQPQLVDFGWSILLGPAVAVATFLVFGLARAAQRVAKPRPFVAVPAAGLAVAGLAIAFSEVAGKSVDYALFSGEETVNPLVAHPGAWSLSALALLLAFKGAAYGLSLGCFRGGPVFPALFLGAAGGMMAAQLPGFALTPAVAVGIGAAVVSVLRLPLAGAILAILLTVGAGAGTTPLIIVGVIAAYLTTLELSARLPGEEETARER